MTETPSLPATRDAPSSIGAGIVGNSLAFHLAELGWTDLVLLDKGPLPNPGGSTGHASNFIFPVDHSKEMTQLTLESVRQYREAGVFTESGGIEVARTEERMQELRRRVASAKAWGIEDVAHPHAGRGEGARAVHRGVGDRRRLLHAVGRHRRLAALRDDRARARAGEGRADACSRTPRCSASTSRAGASPAIKTSRGDIETDRSSSAAASGARRSRGWRARRSR